MIFFSRFFLPIYLCGFFSLSFAQDSSANSKLNSLWTHQLSFQLSASTEASVKNTSFHDTLESYGTDWLALNVNPETAKSWESTSPFFMIHSNEQYSQIFELDFKAGLRRDLEAWYNSSTSHNLILNTKELDINMPIYGYVAFKQPYLNFKIGRFPEHWGPSERSITLSGAPWLDAVKTQFTFPIASYTLLVSSLDSRLLSLPTRSNYSELEIQNQSAQQQRGKIFNENSKTLFGHRFEIQSYGITLGLSELLMIGGKVPTLNDATPFGIWHNAYHDGSSNILMAFDITYTSKNWGSYYSEFGFDDMNSPVGEENESPQSILAFLTGYKNSFDLKNAGTISVKAEWIFEDPSYGNHPIPLLRMNQRVFYRSNYRTQYKPGYADTYIADYPLNYFRGPDVSDIWFDLNWIHPKYGSHNFDIGILQKGSATWIGITKEEYSSHPLGPSGTVEKELRLSYKTEYNLNQNFSLNAQSIYRMIQNRDHIFNQNQNDWSVGFGLNWNLSYIKRSTDVLKD